MQRSRLSLSTILIILHVLIFSVGKYDLCVDLCYVIFILVFITYMKKFNILNGLFFCKNIFVGMIN